MMLFLFGLLPAVLASPVASSDASGKTPVASSVVAGETAVASPVVAGETPEEITDRYLYKTPLADFVKLRDEQNPSNLDWSSDGCSKSVDNPFGFPFLPACQRHDFGYGNYRVQNRYNAESRYLVDDNFLTDMQSQCEGRLGQGSCRALASVYYYAVRMFGPRSKRDDSAANSDEELKALYEEALQAYNEAVKIDQEQGLLPEKESF